MNDQGHVLKKRGVAAACRKNKAPKGVSSPQSVTQLRKGKVRADKTSLLSSLALSIVRRFWILIFRDSMKVFQYFGYSRTVDANSSPVLDYPCSDEILG
jgi:hypothetical protein